ncbi:hypothetical protein KK137_04370 [Croceibacterium sp. LX-88]|uniref:Uncharacterized protein n=1 Tax=Croceibacterium selenioxidans TaxID=2838833 RepID=A0ABS5W1N9_9SPHN|nr:hypothetical protein [Croceibacterium selenioxidans]MBT2133564.1 hypothetical protein [Croceibacterium selenioxidans]
MGFFRVVAPAHVSISSLGSLLLIVSPAFAQEAQSVLPGADLAGNQTEGLQDIGRTAETGTGEVGQRLKREDLALNTAPLARIENRIQNRVENRLESRVESKGFSVADTTSSFKAATARSRNAPLSSEATAVVNEDDVSP